MVQSKTAFDILVNGKDGLGRPKMTWKQLTERDCRKWKLSAITPHDRHTLPLIQEGQLSVSGERMCTILVNRLEDLACPINVFR